MSPSITHFDNLIHNSSKSAKSREDGSDPNDNEKIVGEDSGLIPAIFLCFLVGVVIECWAVARLWTSGGQMGRWLLALCVLCFVYAEVSFWIGCFPWRWKTCVCDKKKNGEYHHSFQHNSVIVPLEIEVWISN